MNCFELINQFIWILQWILLNSSTNTLKFINKFKQIHLNSSTNSLKFINEFIWFHPQIQLNLSTDLFKIFTNFPEILLIFIIWIFLENRQWIHKWIHKRLANSFEFIKEFIWLNQWIYFDLSTDLIQIQLIFCDWHTLWLLETPDLVDYKTEKFNSWKKSSMNSFLIILFKFLLFFRHVANFFYQIY